MEADLFLDFFLGPSPPFFPPSTFPPALLEPAEAVESALGRFALAFPPAFLLLESLPPPLVAASSLTVSFLPPPPLLLSCTALLSSFCFLAASSLATVASASPLILINFPRLALNSASFLNTIFCNINNVNASFLTPSYKSQHLLVGIGSLDTLSSSKTDDICFSVDLLSPECPSTEGGKRRPDWR